MNIKAKVQQAAQQFFLAILPASAGDQAPFKALITIEVDGEHKPLLLVGTAHSRVEDGSCIAILNPDPELIGLLNGGWGSNSLILKEAIAKRCDFALSLWIDAYKNNRVSVVTKYENQSPAPAKFKVHEFPK